MSRSLWTQLWDLIGGVSLRWKIMGIALAMLGILGLGITLQVRQMMGQALTWELEQRGISTAQTLAAQSTDLVLTNNLYTLFELTMDAVQNHPDVRYAFVLDAQRRLLAHSFQGGFPFDLIAANDVAAGQPYHMARLLTEEGVILDIAVPIFGGNAGQVRIGMSQTRLHNTLAAVTRRLILTIVLVSLFGVFVSTLLTWLLSRPILALSQATRRVAQGDLQQRITPWARDEIGALQASFNEMVERLAQSHQEMEAYNRNLLQRNRELSALFAVSRAVAGPLGLQEMLSRALAQVIPILHAQAGWICVLRNDGDCEICVGQWDSELSKAQLSACCRGCPACEEARRRGQPYIVSTLPAGCVLSSRIPGLSSHVLAPLQVRGQVVGMLNLACAEGVTCFCKEDLVLLEAVGRQIGIAIENARLWEELQHKEEIRGELLRKVITAQEEERQRIARELHDETGQALTSLLVNLRLLERAQTPAEIVSQTQEMREIVANILDSIRDLAVELRPSVLDDLGLVPALSRYAQECTKRLGIQVDFIAAGLSQTRLPHEMETTLYRIAQEALTNVARHAQTNHASILLERRGHEVVMIIEDDGCGFNAAQALDTAGRAHLGLFGMRERAELVGGRLVVESAPGGGTTVSVVIPLQKESLCLTDSTPNASAAQSSA
jgi:signal transduction histidine kinase